LRFPEESIYRYLDHLRDYFAQRLLVRLPRPEADLAAGLLWGEQSSLPPDLVLAFRRTGLSHIVAVSGYNFTIILLAISQGLVWLGFNKKKRWWLQLLVIIGFMVFTGASASVLRAGLMAGVVVVAYCAGRSLNFLSLLFGALFLIALLNPSLLVFDIGLQLSVGATAGLVYLVKPLSRYLAWCPTMILETLATTVAALLGTLPIMLAFFGNISLVAILANLLVLPLIAWNMAWAFLTLLLGWLPGLGEAIGLLATMGFRGLIRIVEYLAAWPLAAIALPANFWWLALYVLIIPAGYYLRRYDQRN
jgi:competence protein ComEC